MIRIGNGAMLGRALGDVRILLGIGRREMSRRIAAKTGRTATSVYTQLWGWDTGVHNPDVASLPPLLEELGYDLALIPREDAE